MARILIVEDEPAMRTGLCDNLEFEGYEVETAVNGEEGQSKILNNKYDLILLDVMMPKISGFDVCRKIRKEGIDTPVILLTAKGEEIDKVLGLELGADDYITKPFSLRELLARIKAVLRRAPREEETTESGVKIGKLTVFFEGYKVFDNDLPVQLSHKEFEILKILFENRNGIVSRDMLLNKVWGYEAVPTTRTVDNFILKLRQKTEPDPNNPEVILTVHGVGYKLIH